MKMMIPALLALFAAGPALAVERSYSITDFDQIQVDGSYEVVLSTGRATTAKASGSREALERLSVEVQGRILRIRPNRSAWVGSAEKAPGPVRIEVSTRDLQSALVRGAGRLEVDKARGLRLSLSLSGSGSLNVGTVEADNLTIGLIGSGTLRVSGKAKQLRTTVQGSGSLDGAGLKADDANVIANTDGKITLAAIRTAKVSSAGSGDVEILGTPACTVDARGAGLVTCGKGR